MAPRDKLCLFKKGSSGEIPVKWEGEACQKLWNLSQAPGRFPAVGVKHTIHLICILFQVSCCSAKGEAAAGSSERCTRAHPPCSHSQGWDMKALAPLSCWIPHGNAHLLCSEKTAVSAADVLGITVSEAEGFLRSQLQTPTLL